MYAIVRAGGRQEKVVVGDHVDLDRRTGVPGDGLTLPALLVVDGADVTSDPAALADVTVSAEIVEHTKGPKIAIQHYKNKTGYKRRQGFRAQLTRIRITDISVAAR